MAPRIYMYVRHTQEYIHTCRTHTGVPPRDARALLRPGAALWGRDHHRPQQDHGGDDGDDDGRRRRGRCGCRCVVCVGWADRCRGWVRLPASSMYLSCRLSHRRSIPFDSAGGGEAAEAGGAFVPYAQYAFKGAGAKGGKQARSFSELELYKVCTCVVVFVCMGVRGWLFGGFGMEWVCPW